MGRPVKPSSDTWATRREMDAMPPAGAAKAEAEAGDGDWDGDGDGVVFLGWLGDLLALLLAEWRGGVE